MITFAIFRENYSLAVMRTLVILSSKMWIFARSNLVYKSEKLKKMQVVGIDTCGVCFR